MTNGDRVVVGSCHELVSGDAIEAYYKDTLVHRGPVTDTAPDHGLFWILDTLTGRRRLLDMSELKIIRIPPPTVDSRHYRLFRDDRQPPSEYDPPWSNWRAASHGWRGIWVGRAMIPGLRRRQRRGATKTSSSGSAATFYDQPLDHKHTY